MEQQDDFFHALMHRLPPEIKALSHEQQVSYLKNVLAHMQHEGEHSMHEAMRQNYRETIEKNYKHLHPELLTLQPSFFVKSFWDAIQAGTPEALKSILKQESPGTETKYLKDQGIYSFEMVTKEYCDKLLEEIEHFEKWCTEHNLEVYRPNSMNNYGAILDDFGMYEILQEWVRKLVSPFSKFLYPHFGGDSLDDHHGFVVEYKLGKDVDLGFHVDNSEVTLNVCLGKQFQGGTLYFEGVRCAKHQNTQSKEGEHFVYSHTAGRAVIHVGRHRHGANELLQGERFNLILWCYSSKFRSISSNLHAHNDWCSWK